MKRVVSLFTLLFLTGCIFLVSFPVWGSAPNSPTLVVYSLQQLELLPVTTMSYPVFNAPSLTLVKTGSTYAEPGGMATYEIQLANYESVSRTFTLTEQLPDTLSLSGIEVISGTGGSLHYSRSQHTLSWTGNIEPGHLDYILSQEDGALPYLDLGQYGAANLCDTFISNSQPCDDVLVTFNLGINGRFFPYYGRSFTTLTLSSDGLLLAQEPLTTTLPSSWLPDTAAPAHLMAGFWRNNDLTENGRWHAGIIAEWINGQDVFYAQWQDAPHANNPNQTVRHAMALTLGQGGGDIYLLYDNISDPTAEIQQGYTIGLQDGIGERGLTYAYAPCCNQPHPPLGQPPIPGTVLHLYPTLLETNNDYSLTFRYRVQLNSSVPIGGLIPTTVTAQSNSPDPSLHYQWATHYLFVRELVFLPVAISEEAVSGEAVSEEAISRQQGSYQQERRD